MSLEHFVTLNVCAGIDHTLLYQVQLRIYLKKQVMF